MVNSKEKILKVIGIIIIVLLSISTIALCYSFILFSSLETFYIIMGIVLLIYISNILIYLVLKNIRLKRFKKYFISIIISFIITLLFGIGSYLILTVYSKINTFNKNEITYSTALITFNENYENIENVKDAKIGIVNDEKELELYVLPKEVIKNKALENENVIVEYNSVVDLLNALCDKKVDLAFINGNYKDLFFGLEEYSNIKNAIKVTEYSKKEEKINVENDITNNTSSLTEPFTILLLGVDSASDGLDKNAAFNGDTIMLITFDPQTLNATMFSIPRDTYVKIACGNRQVQKINTSAYGGSNCVIKTVQNMTGISIDYYAKINFRGVVDLVDALGGVVVDVPYKFCEQNSNREFGPDKTIYLEKGIQKLNGEQALGLARNRKGHSECSDEWNTDGVRNDFVRGQNQQLVVESMLNQMKSVKSANQLMDILDIVSKNIDTNLTTEQMLSFYNVVKTIILSGNSNIVNIQKTLLTGYDMYVHESGGERYAFFNWKGSLEDIVTAMEINLGKKQPTIVKEFSFSINLPYERATIGIGSYKETRVSVVPNFTGYSPSEIKSWGNNNGITISLLDYETKKSIESNYSDYIIHSQSVPAKTLITKAGKSIEIFYTSKIKNITDETNNEPDLSEETQEGEA